MSNLIICGTIPASAPCVNGQSIACKGSTSGFVDATKQDVSLTVNLQSEPCADIWAGLLRSDNYQGLYMHSNHRLGHSFSSKKCVGVFVRMNADQFGLRSFVSFALASWYLPFRPACNFLLSLHQLVLDQHPTNIPHFINVGPNVSPTVSQ